MPEYGVRTLVSAKEKARSLSGACGSKGESVFPKDAAGRRVMLLPVCIIRALLRLRQASIKARFRFD